MDGAEWQVRLNDRGFAVEGPVDFELFFRFDYLHMGTTIGFDDSGSPTWSHGHEAWHGSASKHYDMEGHWSFSFYRGEHDGSGLPIYQEHILPASIGDQVLSLLRGKVLAATQQ